MRSFIITAAAGLAAIAAIIGINGTSERAPVAAAGLDRSAIVAPIVAKEHPNGTFHYERVTIYSGGYVIGWHVYLWTPSGARYYQYTSWA